MAFRILVGVNYSAGENVEGDSGMMFITGLVSALVKSDADLHFYLLIPERVARAWSSKLSHPRITMIPFPLLPRLHGGDFQFDPAALYERFDFRRYDVDVLFLNQPETVPAFLQFFNRQTFHNIPAVSYVHWFDTRRPSTPKQEHHRPALLAALSGMAVSTAVGCNSIFGRDRILDQADKWFKPEVVADLRQRLVILPPGIDVPELLKNKVARPRRRKQILVNHRLLKYTGVRSLLSEALPELWSQRQDFQVHVTNPTRVRLPGSLTKAPWLNVETLARNAYVETLWRSDIVVSPHRATYWSISTLEAICADTVPLMNKESFFPELMEPLLDTVSPAKRRHIELQWFYFRGNLVRRLCDLLDNIENERELAREVGRRARAAYGWRAWTDRWREVFYAAERRTPAISERNPSMQRIVQMLRSDGPLPKEEILRRLSWAPKQRALAWSSFRKYLRIAAPDDPTREDVVFDMRPPHGKRTRRG